VFCDVGKIVVNSKILIVSGMPIRVIFQNLHCSTHPDASLLFKIYFSRNKIYAHVVDQFTFTKKGKLIQNVLFGIISLPVA